MFFQSFETVISPARGKRQNNRLELNSSNVFKGFGNPVFLSFCSHRTPVNGPTSSDRSQVKAQGSEPFCAFFVLQSRGTAWSGAELLLNMFGIWLYSTCALICYFSLECFPNLVFVTLTCFLMYIPSNCSLAFLSHLKMFETFLVPI